MAVTIRELAKLVGGKVVGDENLAIESARTLQEARPGDITFLDNARNAPNLGASQASAAVVPTNLPAIPRTVIQSADPLLAFATIMHYFKAKALAAPVGIDPLAFVHPSVKRGAEAVVEPFASIGENSVIGNRCRLHVGVRIGSNCRLGDDVILYPNVVLYDGTVLGDRVIIHANSCLGADGFGYRFQQGRHVKVPQMGNVVVGNDVEIGACSCIDRGTFGSTVIGDGCKLDNMVQVAHNCQIGMHNAIAAQVGIGGSTVTGNYVMMGGQAGVKDHIKIGAGAMIGAKTGVINDVAAGQRMFLYPAHEEHEAARILACMKKLPTMRRDLLRVLKELNLQEQGEPQTTRNPEAPAA